MSLGLREVWMSSVGSQYALEVIGGEDHGARLDVDLNVRMIGRAREADLVLRDLAVSRRHLQVVANQGFVSFALCANASPFVVDGRPLRTFDGKPGDRVLVGNTLLVIVAEGEEQPASVRSRTDVRTLLTGAAADVRGLAAAHALIDALDAAEDHVAIEGALRSWALEHVDASAVELSRVAESSSGPRIVEEVVERSGAIQVAVPVPSSDAWRLVFRLAPPKERVTDSLRRTLVVAERVVGSTLARARLLEVAEAEAASFRTLSLGSARTFIGTSPDAKQLAALVPKLGASDVNVLIEGETGVGKTFVARLIHEASPRAREPLRVINCAAIPESILESELFGHERGAFTGAIAARQGAFEAVGRGTLLLDEVGELSPASQAKLLRVIEERRFERVGSNRSIELRARVLCATNRDLEGMAKSGQFRSDLYFRISVVRVRVAPLRDREGDLVLVAEQLLNDLAARAPRRITGFSPEAIGAIRRYAWPGNVRELRNAIEHAIALGDGPVIEPWELPAGLEGCAAQPVDPDIVRLPADLGTVERRAIEAALRKMKGNRVRAAALLGINRTTLYNKLKEYGMG
jgi:DNA-binding NtrC family response regulator